MFNENDSACSFGVGIGVLAFLACVVFLMLDAYFPNISNAQERKYIVISDLVFCAAWTFLWFISFCVLTNQWTKTEAQNVFADAARGVITFSFFSVITWGLLTYFALGRYRQGVTDFDQNYRDPANDPNTPYQSSPYSSTSSVPGYQQSPFSNPQDPGAYQPPSYWRTKIQTRKSNEEVFFLNTCANCFIYSMDRSVHSPFVPAERICIFLGALRSF